MDLPPNAHMPPYCEEFVLPVSDPIGSCSYSKRCAKPGVISQQPWRCPFLFQEDLAQYGGSDYSNAVRVERGITIDEAMQIALEDPNIDYFFYTKGGRMVLEAPVETTEDPLDLISYHWVADQNGKVEIKLYRIFNHGDAVFFHGDGIWLGEAKGLADVYQKQMHTCVNTSDTH